MSAENPLNQFFRENPFERIFPTSSNKKEKEVNRPPAEDAEWVDVTNEKEKEKEEGSVEEKK